MSKAKLIGSHLKLACENLLAVRKIGTADRTAPTLMFYAVENLVMAVFTSEEVDTRIAREKHGSHQLDRMLVDLPDDCTIKMKFEEVAGLVAYATTYRYPTPAGKLSKPPSNEQAASYFEALIEMLDICATHFQVNVTLDEPEAGSVSPIR